MVTHENARGITRAGLGVIASGALILGAAVPALAITPPTTITDVPTYTTQTGGDLGYSASRVSGDVDGDGLEDTVVGDWWYDKIVTGTGTFTNAGGAYILFGGTSFTGGQLTPDNALPDDAVLIKGPNVGNAFAGISVSIAGDVNGDGYDDVIVGSNRTQRVWVVWGGPTLPGSAPIDLETLSAGSQGIEITNSDAVYDNANGDSANFGYWVSTAGNVTSPDYTNDPYDEIIIVDNLWDKRDINGTVTDANVGRAWVIKGGTGLSGVIDVADNGTGTAQVHATIDGAGGQILVAENIGDVNGDGTPDIGVGSYTSQLGGGGVNTGAAFAVFGDPAPAANIETVDLTAFQTPGSNSDGFPVYGPSGKAYRLGTSITALGDIDGDEIDDFAVGGDAGASLPGGVAVVYGSTSSAIVNTDPNGTGSSVYDTAGDRGYWIDGAANGDRFGWSAASIPDINDDGLPELVVGAWGHDSAANNAGAVYVINSDWVAAGDTEKADNTAFTTSLAGTAGFRINGLAGNSQLGRSVGGITDFDGGGYPSIVGGANGAGTGGVGADYASVFRLS